MSDNLKLWRSVEKTNPNYTKRANVKGNNIISIAPQFQILNATEKFGVYGVTWGFKDISIDYTLTELTGLIYWSATFFFPNGEFPATNSISVWRDGAKTKPDDQFAKKVETDSLTKCLSKLGFNADIFLGKFDDVRYLNDVKEEFKEVPRKEALTTTQFEATKKATKEQIEAVLRKFRMSKDQSDALKLLIKKHNG